MRGEIDQVLREILLLEIAYQRSERDRFRLENERLRAEGCVRAIRALRDVWAAVAYREWTAVHDRMSE